MIISNIQNLITICEETTPTYIPSSPGLPSPSSVTAPPSIRSKYSGLLMKGGLALGAGVGAGLLGHHVLQTHPEISQQIHGAIGSAKSAVSNAATSARGLYDSASQKVGGVINTAKSAIEHHTLDNSIDSISKFDSSHASAAEIKAHLDSIEAKMDKWSELKSDQQDILRKAYVPAQSDLSKLESSGRSDTHWAKNYDPHKFDKIASLDDKVALARSEAGGSGIKADLAEAKTKVVNSDTYKTAAPTVSSLGSSIGSGLKKIGTGVGLLSGK